MILTGPEIEREWKAGRIDIRPFCPSQVSPNSYDFRLGQELKVYRNYILDAKVPNETESIRMDDSGYTLLPGRIYLGHTEEMMGSDHYVPIIRGRSSTARLGLFIHVTADLIDVGSHNQWTLQMHAVQPVTVYPGMRIGQVTFWTIQGDIVLYNGKYQGSLGACESLVHLDFEEKVSARIREDLDGVLR